MNPVIDLLQRTRGTIFVNEDGIGEPFELLPPLSAEELRALEAKLPCRIPSEIRELLLFARGFSGMLDEVHFAGLPGGGFGFEELIPHPVDLAGDGYGNFWVVDLTPDSTSWGPILYACHDAPVLVYQSDTLMHFVEEVLRFGNKPWKSEIDDVHEGLTDRIWRENPGLLSPTECRSGGDPDLAEFAADLDDSWSICDMRNAMLGDGFSWGRHGASTPIRRFGTKRIFAYQFRKRTWKQLLFGG
jgi:cell wall assembly regulator SMI1